MNTKQILEALTDNLGLFTKRVVFTWPGRPAVLKLGMVR